MLPDPLHPAIVHFPVVLVLLLPLVAAMALVAIRRGVAPRTAWTLPTLCAAGLALSSWAAVETGEQEEERVESVVPEPAVDSHSQAAERFLFLSGGMLLLVGAGFLPGRTGSTLRGVATAAALGLTAAGYQVGHSGGALVYRHGAASAYGSAGTAAAGTRAGDADARGGEREDEGKEGR